MPTGLGNLEVELLAFVFELIDDTSPRTVQSLALVNKCFYATYRLIAHRHKTLNLKYRLLEDGRTELQQWLQSEDVLRGLRYLTIGLKHEVNPHDRTVDQDTKFNDLKSLIEKLANLKLLVWNHDSMIPVAILNALHKHHKHAELQIYNFHREDQCADENIESEIALARSPALTAIKASFQNNGQYPDLRDACFKRIVATASNLKFASLQRYTSGCVIYGGMNDEESEQREDKFYTHKKPNSSLKRLTLDGYGMRASVLETWSKFVDLSMLENLKCSSGAPDLDYFQEAPRYLTGLKDVSLNFSYLNVEDDSTRAAVEDYFATTAPLRTLSLWSWMGKVSLSTILARHGETLEVLQLHERDGPSSNAAEMRKVLGPEEMKSIRLACPRLRDLTIDCNRPSVKLDTDVESDAVLRVLREMNLSYLQLYYDLGLGGKSRNDILAYDSDENSSDADDEDEDGDGDGNRDTQDDNERVADDEDNDNLTNNTAKAEGSLPLSKEDDIASYVQRVWRYIFGQQSQGVLEVKVGEWERKM